MRRTAAALLSASSLLATASPAAAIVDQPVSFRVTNQNASGVECPADGARYTVKGHLVAPPGRRSVTVYLHGSLAGEATWRLDLPGYDHALEMARRGHASVTISRIGFTPSVAPDGYLTCLGSDADVAHQIVEELKRGDYTLGQDGPGRPFERVALAGHSTGSKIAEIEAYSFGGIDALVLTGIDHESRVSSEGSSWSAQEVAPCAAGGSPKPPTGLLGYVKLHVERNPDLFFYGYDPTVFNEFVARTELEPCGMFASVPAEGLEQELGALGEISVPVIVINGDHDRFFPPPSADLHKAAFTGSADKTAVTLPDSGHMLMLGRTAPSFRKTLSGWLKERGF
jgi:pimeloyl-ACP methyl ester carboxylesterase